MFKGFGFGLLGFGFGFSFGFCSGLGIGLGFGFCSLQCTYLVTILKALIVWAAVNRGNKIWGAFFLIGLSLCKTRQEKKSNNLHFCSKAHAYTYFKETVNDQSCILTILFAKILMPCPFTGPKMFWAGPNFLCQTKNLFTYSHCAFSSNLFHGQIVQ